MPHRIIRTEQDVADMAKLLATLPRPFTLEWRKGADRSLDQNGLQFKWATEAAQQLGDRTPIEQQHEWKLRHGVPILREENEGFRQFYDTSLKGLPYEQKIAAMEYLPISSVMTVKQMSRYLDTIQRECLEMGLRLTDPDMKEAA